MRLFDDDEVTGAVTTGYQQGMAEAVRDEAIDRVARGMDPDWRNAAAAAVTMVALARDEFTTDDVWDALREVDDAREPRALGAIMRQAQRQGLCVKTDRVVNSRRVECHARPVAVWRSLIVVGEYRG